ncbi:YbgA family protein [Peptoniphilus equinus]|uniref:YbgA family protein n=1 Tax=Peptoniphilus equinus TaxID=3016343 RepID=A0ABY7QRX6_9FIRM|nr:YbgA family protein [Peptoniphilus equinus]WBW49551.1 YbgA family protein [Peptoniphilus equinus]
MPSQKNERQCAETVWARHKYNVLCRSQRIYVAVRTYLKEDVVQVETVQALIDEALVLPITPGEGRNGLLHLWGYFKDRATTAQKKEFFEMLDAFTSGEGDATVLIALLKDYLERYPNRYLMQQSIFDQAESTT